MRQDAEEFQLAIIKKLTALGIEVRQDSEFSSPGGAHFAGDVPDLIVNTKDGKKIVVGIKDGKSYGKLPLSTALELNSFKEANPDVSILLVSLSPIPGILHEALIKIGVNVLEKPTLQKIANTISDPKYSVTA